MKCAYLVIAHGSRRRQANQDFVRFLESFQERYPHRHVEGAFLELAQPTIPEAIEKCVSGGAQEIFVLPLMLFSGRHVQEDIPSFVEEAKAKYPQVDFHYAGPLCDHPMMMELLEEKAKSLSKQTKQAASYGR